MKWPMYNTSASKLWSRRKFRVPTESAPFAGTGVTLSTRSGDISRTKVDPFTIQRRQCSPAPQGCRTVFRTTRRRSRTRPSFCAEKRHSAGRAERSRRLLTCTLAPFNLFFSGGVAAPAPDFLSVIFVILKFLKITRRYSGGKQIEPAHTVDRRGDCTPQSAPECLG